MNCPHCNHTNPADAHYCANCGVQVVAHTGGNAAIADLVNDPSRHATNDLSPSAPTASPTPAPPGNPPETGSYTTAPLADQSSLTATAPLGVDAPTPFRARTSDTHSTIAGRTSSVWPIVLTVAVAAAIVAAGALLILSSGGDDSVASVTTDDNVRSTDVSSTTPPAVVATVPTPATDVPVATAAPGTDPIDTSVNSQPDTTVTTAAPTPPPTAAPPSTDPAAVPPIPPEPGPINAPGSPQVLANVSPSGVPFTESAPAFAIAQEFGDALALQNWNLARTLSPELADNTDDDFALGYANTNRVSLMLVDARRFGPEFELLVVSVAVELGGAQTSLYCLKWDVDPNARTVDQDGGSRIAQWQANAQPEAIRNDADALATVDQCVWP